MAGRSTELFLTKRKPHLKSGHFELASAGTFRLKRTITYASGY
jgi:hypothetical protein